MGTAYLFMGYQQTHVAWLQGLTPQIFQEYLSYLLGKHVLGLTATTGYGHSFGAPSWELILSYEHAIRNKAMTLIKKKEISFASALREAWEDGLTMNRFFMAPLSLEPKKRGLEAATGDEPLQKRPFRSEPGSSSKGAGKGKAKVHRSKGKGKGKNSLAPLNCKSVTAAGKGICFQFNSPAGCHKKGCHFEHVCGKCEGKHPLHECRA